MCICRALALEEFLSYVLFCNLHSVPRAKFFADNLATLALYSVVDKMIYFLSDGDHYVTCMISRMPRRFMQNFLPDNMLYSSLYPDPDNFNIIFNFVFLL